MWTGNHHVEQLLISPRFLDRNFFLFFIKDVVLQRTDAAFVSHWLLFGACDESACLPEQEVRQTDVSLNPNILQTPAAAAASAAAASVAVTHSFHIPVDVSGSEAASSNTYFFTLAYFGALACCSNPFPFGPHSHTAAFYK